MVARRNFGTKHEVIVVELYCRCMQLDPDSEWEDTQKEWFRKEWIRLSRTEVRRLQRQHRKCLERG